MRLDRTRRPSILLFVMALAATAASCAAACTCNVCGSAAIRG